MNLQAVKTTAGIVAIVAMYQFLHVKDPSYPSIFTLISYAFDYITMTLAAFGGYYVFHQYLGMIKYTITEDILGKGTPPIDRPSAVDQAATDKYTEQDSDPEDPENYTSIG